MPELPLPEQRARLEMLRADCTDALQKGYRGLAVAITDLAMAVNLAVSRLDQLEREA